MTNKQKDEKELNRRLFLQKTSFFLLLFVSIICFVLSSVSSFYFVFVGVTFFVSSALLVFITSKRNNELRKLIEKYCPKCGNPTLEFIKTTKEDAGVIRTQFYSRGLVWGKKKLIRETKYYRCSNCGNEVGSQSTCAEG